MGITSRSFARFPITYGSGVATVDGTELRSRSVSAASSAEEVGEEYWIVDGEGDRTILQRRANWLTRLGDRLLILPPA